MEAFFIQKRFLLSAMKPELVLKEENFDLRYEMSRKDDLIRRWVIEKKHISSIYLCYNIFRHYEKIDQWKAILSDLQQPGGSAGGGGVPGGMGPMGQGMGIQPNMGMVPGQQMGPNGIGGMNAGGPKGMGPGQMGGGGGPSGMPTMQVRK